MRSLKRKLSPPTHAPAKSTRSKSRRKPKPRMTFTQVGQNGDDGASAAPTCYYCQKPGHEKNDCSELKADLKAAERLTERDAPRRHRLQDRASCSPLP